MARYGPKPRAVEERFWDHVVRGAPKACWEWRGARHVARVGGYGFLAAPPRDSRRWIMAHRLSWQIHRGPIPKGRYVLHHCDNPLCVNPAHLYVGTQAENVRDMDARGRRVPPRGERNRHAKLTEADVRGIIVELQRLPRRSQAVIARQFGVSQPQVSRIMRREQWAHFWH